MKKKSLLSIAMILVALLTIGGITWATEYTLKIQAEQRASGNDPVMEDGIITWDTEGKKATNGIYYRTIGWNVHKEFVPSGDITKSNMKYGSMVMQQIGEIPTIDGKVKTFFEVEKKDVDRALQLISMEWKQGETVYLSAITEVRQGSQDNYKVLGKYSNLQDLKKAQPWARPDDFDQYFNRKVKLDFTPAEIVEVHLVNGREVNRIDRGKKLPGEKHQTTISKTIEVGGIPADLTKSYAEPFSQRGKKLNPQGSTVTERTDITPPDKGMTIFIEYEMPFPFTVEHVNLDTGEILESEVKNIDDLQTIIVEAKSFTGLSYQYLNVSRDGGNTWGNRSNKTSATVTRQGANLLINGSPRMSAATIEVHAFLLENKPNELGVDVITSDGRTDVDIEESIARIEASENLPVTEIYYYNQEGELIDIQNR